MPTYFHITFFYFLIQQSLHLSYMEYLSHKVGCNQDEIPPTCSLKCLCHNSFQEYICKYLLAKHNANMWYHLVASFPIEYGKYTVLEIQSVPATPVSSS